jgi:hypothetical protein
MTTPPPSIYRQEALAYRLRNRGRRATEIAFPRQMARPVIIALWLALATLVASAVATCLPAVPVRADGLTIVTAQTRNDTDAPVVAVVMPGDYQDQLQPGKRANVLLDAVDDRLQGTIVAVEPELLSTVDVEGRLGLPPAALSVLGDHVTLVWVALDGATKDAFGAATVARATVEVGTTPAGTFLPLIGHLFEE